MWGREEAKVLVTAHMDEIGLMTTKVEDRGRLRVARLGGVHPWKWGEGPVALLGREEKSGVLSMGSIHTEDASSNASRARRGEALTWSEAWVETGLSSEELAEAGIGVGTRIVLSRGRRTLTPLGGGLVSGPFLDDRAPLASMLAAMGADVAWAATCSEEVGGEGACWIMSRMRPEVCIALEIGPNTPDAPCEVSDQPTLWVNDGFAAMRARDIDLVEGVARTLGLRLQRQALSRGGSDASIGASRGLCARPITLGVPVENSHGWEIMHEGALASLTLLTRALVDELASSR
jgi:putative aminopeptidase FrvX